MNTRSLLTVWTISLALAASFAVASESVSPSDAVARMDELWSKRPRPGVMEDAIRIGEEALRSSPERYDLVWRLARAWWWIGYAHEERRREASERAVEVAASAVALRPDGIEGRAYHAFALGDYGRSIGILHAVYEGMATRFEEAILKAYELDRDFLQGGVIAAVGRYYFLLPWPLRDFEKSRRYLEEAKMRHPTTLLGRLYLAETYWELGEKEKARAELEYVVSHDPVPSRVPEDGPARDDARRRLAEWFGS